MLESKPFVMRAKILISLALIVVFGPALLAQEKAGYVGTETCALCHEEISALQSASRMAQTWRDPLADPFDEGYSNTKLDGTSPSLLYRVAREKDRLLYSIQMPGQEPVIQQVRKVTGGPRFGVGFLLQMDAFRGFKLVRPVHIEARYSHRSQTGLLGLTAGHKQEKPNSWEDAFGRVLSPEFQIKCLTCHRSPEHSPLQEAGVHCEDCHGPGEAHVEAVGEDLPDLKIHNPAKISHRAVLDVCGDCHSSLQDVSSDPLPSELLISNQVTGLVRTQCFIQSGEQLSCVTCHDPHTNASKDEAHYVEACQSCHKLDRTQAALCPVNAKDGCVGCHMQRRREGQMVDHWIRVLPDTGRGTGGSATGSRVPPRQVFLRSLTVSSRTLAENAAALLHQDTSFPAVVEQFSPFTLDGGYLGAVDISKLQQKLAAAAVQLGHGEISGILETGGAFTIIQRMPRDFRWEAERSLTEALVQIAARQPLKAIAAYRQALNHNPHYLKALLGLGGMLRRAGDLPGSGTILQSAVRIFPSDWQAHYQLALSYGMAGRTPLELRALNRALALEPEAIPVRMRLGVVLTGLGRLDEAAHEFEETLRINPLVASAHYNLGRVREQQGRPEESRRSLEMAAAIDPKFAPSEK